jgi:hypothetical protein
VALDIGRPEGRELLQAPVRAKASRKLELASRSSRYVELDHRL